MDHRRQHRGRWRPALPQRQTVRAALTFPAMGAPAHRFAISGHHCRPVPSDRWRAERRLGAPRWTFLVTQGDTADRRCPTPASDQSGISDLAGGSSRSQAEVVVDLAPWPPGGYITPDMTRDLRP